MGRRSGRLLNLDKLNISFSSFELKIHVIVFLKGLQ